MARLNKQIDVKGDEEFPELSTLLQNPTKTPRKPLQQEQGTGRANGHIGEFEENETRNLGHLKGSSSSTSKSSIRGCCDERQARKQKSLGPPKFAHVNSLLLQGSLSRNKHNNRQKYATKSPKNARSSPRKSAKRVVDYRKFAISLSSRDDESVDKFSSFVVPDSPSDEEIATLCSPRKNTKYLKKTSPNQNNDNTPKSRGILQWEKTNPVFIDLTSPRKNSQSGICPETQLCDRLPSREKGMCRDLDDLNEPFAQLRFSPPTSKSPSKSKHKPRQVTHPSSQSKPIVNSPPRKRHIPCSPHRPSIDAFWSQDVINDWNDQNSPKKPPRSPSKHIAFPLNKDSEAISTPASPSKSPLTPALKKDKESLEARKAFNGKKHALAVAFLAELDSTIANSAVSALASSTGGIQITWSKKLSSTAGRANWRRETIRSKSSTNDGTSTETTDTIATHRDHASIELAEKVIDDEDRLINVLAHEYCHLANFMISNVKNNPHGASFKIWAAKTTSAFAHRGINVTTKHSYDIGYKYVWACEGEGCGREYKRHSKSVDVKRSRCGRCRGGLVQVKPVPRGGEGLKKSEWRLFVEREGESQEGEAWGGVWGGYGGAGEGV